MPAGDVVRVGSLATDPAGCPGLAQRQLAELVGEACTLTSGGELQAAGPHGHHAGAGRQVGVGVAVDLGVAVGRLAGTLQRGEQPSRVGGDQEPRIVQQASQLADVGGVPGQLAVQVRVGGRPVAGAIGGAGDGVEQAAEDGLLGADRAGMLLVAVAEPVGQGLVVEPVAGGLAGDDGFDEVVRCGVQQRRDIVGGVAAAGPGQGGRQAWPEPGVVEGQAVAAGVGQRAEQILDPVLLVLAAEAGEVLVHGGGDRFGELLPAGVVRADRLAAQQQGAAGELAD